MTIRKVREINGPLCKAIVYRDSDCDEYLVRFHYPAPIGYLSEADYFTNDKADAIATAKHSAGV